MATLPMISASVRRLNSRRTRATISPPTIWAPATIAAASPAMPYAPLVAVQLEQVRLERVERVEPDAGRERRRQHQPAHRRVAQAAVDRAAQDTSGPSPTGLAPCRGLNPMSCMNRKATTSVTPSIAARRMYGTPRSVTWAMTPPSDRADQHRRPADRLGPTEDRLRGCP